MKIAIAAGLVLGALVSSACAEVAEEKIAPAASAWHLAWGNFCRRSIFGQNASSYELAPGSDSANREPWLPYCSGYFDPMWDLAQVYQIICVPKGTRKFEIKGSVIVAYAEASEEEKQIPPPVFVMDAWETQTVEGTKR